MSGYKQTFDDRRQRAADAKKAMLERAKRVSASRPAEDSATAKRDD